MEVIDHSKSLLVRLQADQSPSAQWLKEQVLTSETAVAELLLLAHDAGFASIGHMFASKDKSSLILIEFLRSGCIMKTNEEVQKASVEEIKKWLAYAFRFREQQLLMLEKKVANSQASNDTLAERWTQTANDYRFKPVDQIVAEMVAKRKPGPFYYKNRGLNEPTDA